MTDHSEKKAILSTAAVRFELPIYTATLGNDVIDVSAITNQGLFTYDAGFVSTAACESKITYIDGDKGVLLYRGYPIEELAEKKDYMEVCYLLLKGTLPSPAEKATWLENLHANSVIPNYIHDAIKHMPVNAHPMSLLLTCISMLSAHYQSNNIQPNTAPAMIAIVPQLVAMIYRHMKGLPTIAYDKERSFTENFLHMTFGKEQVDPILTQALDTIFTLHADHEQNASTSTVRMVASTGANPVACLAAGAAALWGPAHGGANEACLAMLKTIGDVTQIPKYIAKSKDKNDSFRLMGFGHRVYKNFDPRAKIMQQICHDVLEATGAHNQPLFVLATELARIAREDQYFIDKKLYPNVDFYSGVTLQAMGIPEAMFTTIFALGRTVGWLSHAIELLDGAYKLSRPRQWYTGETVRHL